MRLLLVALWFLFIASASFWLPAYQGEIGGEESMLVPVYAVVAGLVALGVRRRAESVHAALKSALPLIALLVLAALSGIGMNEAREEFRGGPIYLYFGVALWASWAVLLVSTALLSRTKWNDLAGTAIGCIVVLLGWVLFVARID